MAAVGLRGRGDRVTPPPADRPTATAALRRVVAPVVYVAALWGVLTVCVPREEGFYGPPDAPPDLRGRFVASAHGGGKFWWHPRWLAVGALGSRLDGTAARGAPDRITGGPHLGLLRNRSTISAEQWYGRYGEFDLGPAGRFDPYETLAVRWYSVSVCHVSLWAAVCGAGFAFARRRAGPRPRGPARRLGRPWVWAAAVLGAATVACPYEAETGVPVHVAAARATGFAAHPRAVHLLVHWPVPVPGAPGETWRGGRPAWGVLKLRHSPPDAYSETPGGDTFVAVSLWWLAAGPLLANAVTLVRRRRVRSAPA